MTREEFQKQYEPYVEHETLLRLSDVLDAAYKKITEYEKPRFLEKRVNGRVFRTLVWLEIVFFADMASGEIEFYGIKPPSLDMAKGGNIFELPGIPLDKPLGEQQTLDWAKIMEICATMNRNLPYPVALPFVRIAVDETRTQSLFYRLRNIEYPP